MNTSQDKQRINKGEKDSFKDNERLSQSEQLMPELRTLAYCQIKSIERGYVENFCVKNKVLCSDHAPRSYHPHEVEIRNFYRFEGITDPADMAILYVIETADGCRGTLIDAYGTYSNPEIDEFISAVHTIAKQGRHTR